MRFNIAIITFCILCSCMTRQAQANDAMLQSMQSQIASLQKTMESLQSTIQNQNELIQAQGNKIQFLENRVEKGISGPSGTGTTVAGGRSTLPPAPPQRGLANWNPEIGVVGDTVAWLTQDTEDDEGRDSIAVRELELVFGQYVDPYSRFDAAITLNDALDDQNAEIEQAFYTRWGLPLGFTTVIGKFRPVIGKANLVDRHALDTTTEPLVISDFFGEEGWSTSGVRLQNYIPNPWGIPLKITGEVLNNSGARSFSGVRRRPIFNAHLSSFFQMTDTQTLELGGTSLFGTNNLSGGAIGNADYDVHVFGFDLTYLHLLDGVRRLKLQSEMYFQERKFPNPVVVVNEDGEEAPMGHINNQPFGLYALLDYRMNEQFSIGFRGDYLKPLGSVDIVDGVVVDAVNFGSAYSWEISPYITFHQSEFAKFRLMYSYTERAGAKSDNGIYLQAVVQIGTDRHGM